MVDGGLGQIVGLHAGQAVYRHGPEGAGLKEKRHGQGRHYRQKYEDGDVGEALVFAVAPDYVHCQQLTPLSGLFKEANSQKPGVRIQNRFFIGFKQFAHFFQLYHQKIFFPFSLHSFPFF